MKAHFRIIGLCLAFVALGLAANAQLTGTRTIPSTAYPTLKVAIDSLNQYGVGTGGVIIRFSSATTETAPSGGYRLGSAVLNASTSATKTVTINGSNTTLIGYTGISSSADGIFYIQGTDYVTINNLNLSESSSNTSSTRMMEWGYALVKLSSSAPYDGCQHVTINGCSISLTKTYANTIGIRAAHSVAGSSSTLSSSGATAASTNSYNSFTGNVIDNVTRGISLIGISTVAGYDKANVIGGMTAASGNKITAGGATSTSYNVWLQYDSVITVSNNRFYVNASQGNTSVYELYMSTGRGDLTVTDNLFDVNCRMTSASMYAYYNNGSHEDPSSGINAASTHTISRNKITGDNPVASTSYLYGLYESSAASKNLYINDNEIRNIDWNVSRGYLYLVYQYLTQSPNVEINNNTIYDISVRQTSSSGYIYGYYLYNYNTPTGKLSVQNNSFRKIKSNFYIYPFYNYASYTNPPTGYPGQIVTCKYNVTDSIDLTTAPGTAYCYNYQCYNGFDSTEVSYNQQTNVRGSLTGTTYNYFLTMGNYAPNLYTVKKNLISNITGFNLYCTSYLGYYATLSDSNEVSNVTWTGTSGGMTNYLGYYGSNYVSSHNRVDSINAGGGSVANYMGMYGSDALVHHNSITNIRLNNSAYLYNYIGYNPSNCEVHHVRVDSITQGSNNTFYPWYSYANGKLSLHHNIVSNLTTGSTTISLRPYYLLSSNATTETYFFNNLLSNINLPAGFANSNGVGIYLGSGSPYKLYHNTIRISPGITGGSGYGFTGIYYPTTASLDLRNNIINVNVTPTTGGFTTALRRSSGTSGTVPVNFLGTSNGNIYFAPNAANSWLYGEGGSAASMLNTYNLTNDPNFNTPCGLFKSFMGHDQASFTINNLIPGALPGTYVPTGSAYAEKGAVPTSSPTVVFDFAGVTRGAVADIGALEFSGTPLDFAPPIISYTSVPTRSYCSTPPSLLVTITDNSGVNNTTGTAPRLYYKKNSEQDTFSATNNTNTFNGWKYVEATSVSGSVYTFDFDYSLLTSTVGPGDSITYFLIAQDKASTVNTGASVMGFPVCPGSVALNSTHGPTNKSPVANGFRILSTPTFTATSFPGSSCGPGSTVFNVSPNPLGTAIQWQSATLTGTFSNISGATGVSYTTPVNTATMRYRALIQCGSSTLATTVADTFIIAAPAVLSTTGDTVCGFDSLTLTANVTPFTIANWYKTSTGGTAFFSGNTYVSPPRNSNVTYYVSANTPNASTEMVSKTPPSAYTYAAYDGAGIEIRFRNPATNFYSTTVYPWNANGSFYVELRDSLDTPVPGYIAGPFTVSGGSGTTPQVLQLNWKNIPAGRYWLVMTGIASGTYPSLNMEYNPPGYPFNSPSGNASILSGRYSTSPYYAYFYYNVIGADCESTAPRTPVTGVVTAPAAMTASSPGVPGICAGSSTSLSVTSANSNYVYTWTPKPNTGVLSGPSHTVSPSVTTVYDLIAFDPYTGCKNHDSFVINVNQVPTPPTIAPTSATICGGKSVQLVATAPLGAAYTGSQIGSGTNSYGSGYSLWFPFGGYYMGQHTQYLIRASELVAAGVKKGGLTSVSFYQVTPPASTIATYQMRMAQTTLTGLSGSFVSTGFTTVANLSALSVTGTGWKTISFSTPFMWDGSSNVILDIAQNNCTSCPTSNCSAVYAQSGDVRYTNTSFTSVLYGYSYGGCDVASFTPTQRWYGTYGTSSRPNMYFGWRALADINWLNVTGLYKGNNRSGGSMSLTDTNSVVYASPAVTTVYTAITNFQGCKSLPSLPDTVTVIPSPVVTVNPAGPQTICAGQPVTLCIPTGANQVYQWYLNNVAIAGANSNCYVAGAAGTYRVAATNLITGCADTSIPTVLTVNPIPAVNISASGPLTICNGSNVVLTANSPTAIAWQWELNGVNVPGATSGSLTATDSGVYTVVVTNGMGCSNTSASVTVKVNVTPNTVTPQSSTSFCAGDSVDLQAAVGANLNYQWHNGSGPLTNDTLSVYTARTTGNYYVVVTNKSTGCAATSNPISVSAGAGPNAAITPQGTVGGCQGGTVTLHAVNQPGLCYQWNLNGAPISGANRDSLVVSGAGSYTVTVTICGTSCNSTTATPTVLNLNAPPSASVTPATVTPFCQGDSVVLNAGTGAGLAYQWEMNGATISGATNASLVVKANGSYAVRVINTGTGCSDTSVIVSVSVKPAPNSTITPATSPTFCQGGSVVLNAAGTGVSGYQWYMNGNAIPASNGGQASSLTATATGLYTVKVTSSNGCSATSVPSSVQVNALPDVTTVPTGTAAVCQGYTTVLSAVAGPGLTYQWYNGTNPIAGATGSTYSTGTAGTYSVKITNTVTGCFATSGSIVLSVNTPPTATASLAGSGIICDGDSLKLSANAASGLSYQWKFNGSDIAGATNSVFYAKTGGRYTVAVSSATNCTTLSNSLVITVNPRPAAYITYNTPLDFCEGSAVVLTANAGTGLSYQWYMNGLPLSNTTNINIAALTGKYTLKVTNNFQCMNMADTLDVTVYPTPIPAIVRTNNTLGTAQPYVSYQWFFNNDPIGGATSATHTFTENGAYKVRVVDSNGCFGFSNQFFVNNVGIAQTAAARSVKVYPNPTTGKVHIDSKVRMKMVVRDVTGKTVLEAKDVNEIDLSDMAAGMYQLFISDLEGQLLRVEKLSKLDR